MTTVPQLRLYKDESLNAEHLERLNEIWNLFREDNPKWVLRHECLNLKNADNFIFVFSSFEGAAFEHLRQLKARIISAHCMLNSLKQQKKLPRSLVPIYSSAMVDLNICCTNMEKKLREEIYDKVEMMRGKTSKIFTEKVTHLVTTEVGSAKYHAAGGMKIPVMLPEWIFDLWKSTEKDDVHATDPRFNKHKCPVFHKYVICASGFNETTKNEIKSLVETGGGTYRGDLVCGTTTHLIINEAKGVKYDHAKLWKMNIVKPKWIYDSMEAGYCLPEKNYVVDSSNQTSTPTEAINKVKRVIPDIDISVINTMNSSRNDNFASAANSSAKLVNETERRYSHTTFNNTNNSFNMLNASNLPGTAMKKPEPAANNYAQTLEQLNSIGKIKFTLFDGIGIYCENFDSAINEKLRKICDAGGAIRFEEYNSDVTHVIANQVNEKNCKNYIEMNPEVNIVSVDWLIKSCKENHLAECKTYCVFKNALNSVKTPKKRARPEKAAHDIKSFNTDLNDCLSQYLNQEPQQPNVIQPSAALQKSINTFSSRNGSFANNLNNISMSKREPELVLNDKNGVFAKKCFQIIGFDENETQALDKVLNENGATVVPFDPNTSSYKGKHPIDFTLLPMTIPAAISNNNPVTVYWMKKCVEQNSLMPLSQDIFYQPIPKYSTDKPLTGCVITISGYGGAEKDNISNLCKLLGAHTQQSLSLKRANDILPNTHLICNQSFGPKYVAAKSWNLPIVSMEWVVGCCAAGSKILEEHYSIEKQHVNRAELIENLATMRRYKDEQSTTFNSSTTRRSLNRTNTNNTTLNNNENNKSLDETAQMDDQEQKNMNDSSLSYPNETKKPRLDNHEHNEDTHMNPNETDDQMLLEALKNTDNQFNQPSSVAARKSTIQTPLNPRLQEIKRQSYFSPSAAGPQNNSSPEISNKNQAQQQVVTTPQWIKPNDARQSTNGEFRLNVDYDKVAEYFRTPEAISSNSRLKAKNQETPLDELFTSSIQIACENSKKPSFYANYYQSPAIEYSFEKKSKTNFHDESNRNDLQFNNQPNAHGNHPNGFHFNNDEHDKIQPTPAHLKQKKQILKNKNIYVSKKLLKYQAELFHLVEYLGGDFSWTYNQMCTHFIYTGYLTDNNKELRMALDEKKTIISPNWLYECQEQNRYVEEEEYLIKYNEDSSNGTFQESHANTENASEEAMQTDEKTRHQVCSEPMAKSNSAPSNEETDSMDIKKLLLDQLQDKLANMKNTTQNKKWNKNHSANDMLNSNDSNDGYNSNEKPDRNLDASTSDETVLTEQLNKLNKSKSKWGVNCVEKRKKSKSENDSEDGPHEDNKHSETALYHNAINNNKRKANLAASKEMNENRNHFMHDDLCMSPSMINKSDKNKNKFQYANNHMPASSQIQVTIWKEDQ